MKRLAALLMAYGIAATALANCPPCPNNPDNPCFGTPPETNCAPGSVSLSPITWDPGSITCVGSTIAASVTPSVSNGRISITSTDPCCCSVTNEQTDVVQTNAAYAVSGVVSETGSGLSVSFSSSTAGTGTATFTLRGTAHCPVSGSPATSSGGYTFVGVEVTAPAPTIDGNNSGEFSVAVTPKSATVSTYNWIWEAPAGAGNNPQVNFVSGSASITTVANAHWFAFPNVRVGSNPSAEYTINCEVTVGGQTCRAPTPARWKVYVPDPAASTSFPAIEGMPDISLRVVGGSNEWYVSGMGTLYRREPVVVSSIPTSSQFYNKIVTVHEGRHVEQFTTGVPGLTLHTLWNPTALYNNVLQGMTSRVSEQDLRDRISAQIKLQNLLDNMEAEAQRFLAEIDAHTKSNEVPPHYLEPF